MGTHIAKGVKTELKISVYRQNIIQTIQITHFASQKQLHVQ